MSTSYNIYVACSQTNKLYTTAHVSTTADHSILVTNQIRNNLDQEACVKIFVVLNSLGCE